MKKHQFIHVVLIISLLLGLLFSGCPADTNDNSTEGPAPLEGKLLILQAYGTGDPTDGAVSHSFVELYNTTNKEINLNGLSLQYADGYVFPALEDGPWKKINLEGSIGSESSFLVLGARRNLSANLQIETGFGDINDENFILSNRSFKIALIDNQNMLTVQNPFNTDGRLTKASGYVDMVGAVNNDELDKINGYETEKTRMTKQVSVRRKSLIDTDSNENDFERITYNRIRSEALPYYRPHNSKTDGQWDPMERPPVTVQQSLIIFQVYAGSDSESAGTHTFAELYNNSDTAIDLDSYSLQYASGRASDKPTIDPWAKMDLSGTIPAHGSFLIRGAPTHPAPTAAAPNAGRLQITVFDMDDPGFSISNRSFKVALMFNQDLLAAANPFDIDGELTQAPGFVDLIGATNTGNSDFIDASKGSYFNDISKQKAARRASLDGIDDNRADFKSIDYRTADLGKFEPKTSTAGFYIPQF